LPWRPGQPPRASHRLCLRDGVRRETSGPGRRLKTVPFRLIATARKPGREALAFASHLPHHRIAFPPLIVVSSAQPFFQFPHLRPSPPPVGDGFGLHGGGQLESGGGRILRRNTGASAGASADRQRRHRNYPYSFEAGGQMTGFAVDVFAAVAQRMDLKYELARVAAMDDLRRFAAGDFDVGNGIRTSPAARPTPSIRCRSSPCRERFSCAKATAFQDDDRSARPTARVATPTQGHVYAMLKGLAPELVREVFQSGRPATASPAAKSTPC